MGCTPSKSAVVYGQDKVCRDLDTCSTFVPSLKSAVSTPERPSPRVYVETSSGKQTFLNVPSRDVHGRTVSQSSSCQELCSCSTADTSVGPSTSSSCGDHPWSPSPVPHSDTVWRVTDE